MKSSATGETPRETDRLQGCEERRTPRSAD
jgi:hypothetical protein